MTAAEDRSKLLGDAEYFCGELIHRLERLQRAAPAREHWRTASQLTRRIRVEIRRARERDREQRRREQRLQENRR